MWMVLAAKDFVSVDLSSIFFLIRKVPYSLPYGLHQIHAKCTLATVSLGRNFLGMLL